MKRLLAAIVLGTIVGALPAAAADDTAKKAAAKPVASSKLSLDPVNGKFHQMHTQKLKMSCDTCHASELNDVLFLRASEALRGPGPVDRATCLGCHQVPAKPAWYGATR